jgi:hypothetical protein
VKKALVLLCVIFFILSCKKDDGPDTFDFTVSGIEKIETRVEETRTIRLLITSNEISPENVFLTIEDVPSGISYTLDQASGVPEFASTLVLKISRSVTGGAHTLRLIATSGNLLKVFPIDIHIDKTLSAVFTVYNATTYNPENMSSNLVDSALVKLYNSDATFVSGVPDYKEYSDKSGKARFYKLPPGIYFFTIEKGNLTNVVQKQMIDGAMKGFVVAGLFRTMQEIINSAQPKARTGDLKFRDLNADNTINALDLGQYDNLSIYEGELNEKVIWIGE